MSLTGFMLVGFGLFVAYLVYSGEVRITIHRDPDSRLSKLTCFCLVSSIGVGVVYWVHLLSPLSLGMFLVGIACAMLGAEIGLLVDK